MQTICHGTAAFSVRNTFRYNHFCAARSLLFWWLFTSPPWSLSKLAYMKTLLVSLSVRYQERRSLRATYHQQQSMLKTKLSQIAFGLGMAQTYQSADSNINLSERNYCGTLHHAINHVNLSKWRRYHATPEGTQTAITPNQNVPERACR